MERASITIRIGNNEVKQSIEVPQGFTPWMIYLLLLGALKGQ